MLQLPCMMSDGWMDRGRDAETANTVLVNEFTLQLQHLP